MNGEIIVRLKKGEVWPHGRGLRAKGVNLGKFDGRITELGMKRSDRYQSFSAFSRKAGLQKGLGRYLRVRIKNGMDPETLARKVIAFSDLGDIVATAVPAALPGPPTDDDTPAVANAPYAAPDFEPEQQYLDPQGVDARYAWTIGGGQGQNVKICLCEYGYDATHPDFPEIEEVDTGGDSSMYTGHGTKTFGVIAALKDGSGVTGIAHGSKFLFSCTVTGWAPAIDAAIASLETGDILLLEMQTWDYLPVEYDEDIRQAIKDATARGIVVVASAGNGGKDLADQTDGYGRRIWDPDSPDHDDSGAILVGAGTHDTHDRIPSSNYGERVNCQGWGEGVVTTGGGDKDHPNGLYTGSFAQTSSASAMVAGVAACIQGATKQREGQPVDPPQLRALLSNPAYATVPYSQQALIGPLPNMKRILETRAQGII